MSCGEVRPWLGALLDNELDAKNSAEMHAHLAQCPSCLAAYRVEQAMRENLQRTGLKYDVPEHLRERIANMLPPPMEDRAHQPSRPQTANRATVLRWVSWGGWPVAIAASALLAVRGVEDRADIRNEIVALHVRSLLGDHLSDVASSDRHTVKPWFAGKLDFAPPVPDLSQRGYILRGGRLDYLRDRVVAAIVYQKRSHAINVLVSPEADLRALAPASADRGYRLRTWQASGLSFAAISDMDPAELEAFQRAFVSSY